MPEQIVLFEKRRVRPHEVSAWIEAALDRLFDAARRYGGIAGAPFIIYHGPIGEDEDGPAEACVPVARATTVSGGAVDSRESAPVSRREPAHREVYVTLTKAHVVYPKIKVAYRAVAQWIDSHGRVSCGPPREVYFAEFGAAAPDDEVCDVAFPIGV